MSQFLNYEVTNKLNVSEDIIGTNKLSIPAKLNCSIEVANNAIKGRKIEISWFPKYAIDPVIIKLTRNIVAVPINDFL